MKRETRHQRLRRSNNSTQRNRTKRSLSSAPKFQQEITVKFMEILMMIKLYHWKTHSYSTHKATDELYSKLNDCNPLPNPGDTDPFTRVNLLNLLPHERILIHDRCYAVKSLYEWIIIKKNNELPRIKTELSEEQRQLPEEQISEIDKQRLIEAYEIMI